MSDDLRVDRGACRTGGRHRRRALGEQADKLLAARAVPRAHAPDVAVVGAGAQQLGEGDLIGRRNVHVLDRAQLENGLEQLRRQQEPDPALRELVRIRASQLNGCSYCVDYHSGDARAAGEDERRIWAVAAWRDNPLFDERERAALALTDALTRLPEGGVPEGVYAEAARHFDDAELGNLMGAIIAINAWNRVGVGTKLAPELEPAAA